MMEPLSKTRFMESMWRDLPTGVLERVFTFLPIASLCRFRALSKEWNRFISNPTFKHAAGAAEDDYALITPRWNWNCWTKEGGWMVLDVARKRYFMLSDAFLIKHMEHQVVLMADAGERMEYPLSLLAAIDGGLICVYLWCDVPRKASGVYVCNPVLKTVKHLPLPAALEQNMLWETFVMATDRSSMEYEVIFVRTAYAESFNPELIHIYKSKTGKWKTAPFGPIKYAIWWHSLTIFNNNLYLIVNRGDSSRDGLVSYNKETGVVSDLGGIDFPSPFRANFAMKSYLVVSKARLFCVIPVRYSRANLPKVEIFEIDVVKETSTFVTEMPRSLFFWVLCYDIESRDSDFNTRAEIQVAAGSADCILIATVIGRCAAYSLSRNSWYRFPDDPALLGALSGGKTVREELYGSNISLSLCAP